MNCAIRTDVPLAVTASKSLMPGQPPYARKDRVSTGAPGTVIGLTFGVVWPPISGRRSPLLKFTENHLSRNATALTPETLRSWMMLSPVANMLLPPSDSQEPTTVMSSPGSLEKSPLLNVKLPRLQAVYSSVLYPAIFRWLVRPPRPLPTPEDGPMVLYTS
ncbi:MAG: hypothetical protein ACYDIE_08715 [Candidatus Krumholzibacteriia bacterium]